MIHGDRFQQKPLVEMLVRESGTGFAQTDEAEKPAMGGNVIASVINGREGLDEVTAAFPLLQQHTKHTWSL